MRAINDGLTSTQRYAKRATADGRCAHCGKPCAPYTICEDRRAYLRQKQAERHRKQGKAMRGPVAFSDRRRWPKDHRKAVPLHVPLAETPPEKNWLRAIEDALPDVNKETQDEIRQRLVVGILEGEIPAEFVKQAAIKIRRAIELKEVLRGHEDIAEYELVQPDFAPELIESIDRCEAIVNIPFAQWPGALDVWAGGPSEAIVYEKPYQHPTPIRGQREQNGYRKMQSAWRYAA